MTQTAAARPPLAHWQPNGESAQQVRTAGPSAGYPPARKEGGDGGAEVSVGTRRGGAEGEDSPGHRGPVGPPTPAEAREQQRLWQQYQRRYHQQRQDQQQVHHEGRVQQAGRDGEGAWGAAGSSTGGSQQQPRQPDMEAAPSSSSSKGAGAYSPTGSAAAATAYPPTPSATPNSRSYGSASSSPAEAGARQQQGHAQPSTVGEAEDVGCAARRQTQELISMADRLIGTWRGRCVSNAACVALAMQMRHNKCRHWVEQCSNAAGSLARGAAGA